MKNANAKLIVVVVGFLVLMMMMMNLPHTLQGGNIDVGGSKYEDYGLMVIGSDDPLLMGRKLKSLKAIESATKKRTTKGLASRDSATEIDNLMRGDYSSRMKGRKRSPIHN
ncbi:hypothetical protein Bca4012_086152 [Brassica carinata]|uniref:Uncharacterized protein n=1 Tax=Brassica carinata TaxID=52824 RepID=A0A8X7QNA2_BRACI|nr:hypothetical protein Bca52824_067806 [Brassica carinata]